MRKCTCCGLVFVLDQELPEIPDPEIPEAILMDDLALMGNSVEVATPILEEEKVSTISKKKEIWIETRNGGKICCACTRVWSLVIFVVFLIVATVFIGGVTGVFASRVSRPESLYAVVAAYGGNICAGLVMDLYDGFEFTQNNSSLNGYTGTVPISNRIQILPDVSNCASQCQSQAGCGYFGYSLQPNTGGYAFCFLYITGTPGDCTVIPNIIERPPPQVTIYAL